MFRCPSCAQAHQMKIDDQTIFTQNKEMTTLYLNQNEVESDTTLRSNPDVACTKCHEVNPLKLWEDAFADPGRYFDADNLCHCGGELWMDQIPGTSTYGFVCDDCKWVKPKHTVSGG